MTNEEEKEYQERSIGVNAWSMLYNVAESQRIVIEIKIGEQRWVRNDSFLQNTYNTE